MNSHDTIDTDAVGNSLDRATTNDAESPAEEIAASFFAEELKLIKSLPQPETEEINKRFVLLGKKTKKYTLILDLDETLVKAIEVPAIEKQGLAAGLGFRVRPHTEDLLKRLSEKYEIIIFTAAEESYGYQALDSLDRDRRYVSKLLGRSHCIYIPQGLWVKDLRIFADRALDEILIADNSILSFSFQLANGIPVMAYDGSSEDDELLVLIDYLEELYEQENIVKVNCERTGLAA